MIGIGWRADRAQRLPRLDPSRCTSCGDCVRICPADCLAFGTPLPWLPRPADCLSCGACATICTSQAIVMPSLDPATAAPARCDDTMEPSQ